jgi:diguanylate cyclase (GGDEF)-like protein
MTHRAIAAGTGPAEAAASPRALQELAETVQRSRLGGPFYVVAWIMIGLAANLQDVAPWGFAGVTLGFVALALARPLVRNDGVAGAVEVDRRLWIIWGILLATFALWGAAAGWLMLIAVDDSSRTLAAIGCYALATACAHNYSMRRERAMAAIALVYLPMMAGFVFSKAPFGFFGIGLLFLVYLVLALRRSHREYLERLDLEEELRRQRDLFEQQSQRDGLTGLANRRRFASVLEQWVAQARAAPMPFVLMIFDLDWFKSVNDRHGHAVGDATLRAFAQALQDHFSDPQDLVARLGGEEFGVLIRDCAVAVAVPRADAFREALAGRPLPIAGLALGLTVSVGVGGFEPNRHADGDALYNAVDQALYRAKASGRNLVRQAEVAE